MLGIAPFNFPLNLCAHKVAPAIAAGAPIILKPAPATPLSGLILGDLLAETDLPAGSWSILPVTNDKMPALVQDERLPVISFTGSEKVGYVIMDSVPRKHCTLELGGNGAAVVLGDYASDADLDWAATRIATFSNYQGGQSCISVQRVIADASVYDRLLPRIVAAVEAQVTGDPSDATTDVGPLGQRGRRPARGVLGGRGGRRRRHPCSPAASATAPRTRRPCSPTCRRT